MTGPQRELINRQDQSPPRSNGQRRLPSVRHHGECEQHRISALDVHGPSGLGLSRVTSPAAEPRRRALPSPEGRCRSGASERTATGVTGPDGTSPSHHRRGDRGSARGEDAGCMERGASHVASGELAPVAHAGIAPWHEVSPVMQAPHRVPRWFGMTRIGGQPVASTIHPDEARLRPRAPPPHSVRVGVPEPDAPGPYSAIAPANNLRGPSPPAEPALSTSRFSVPDSALEIEIPTRSRLHPLDDLVPQLEGIAQRPDSSLMTEDADARSLGSHSLLASRRTRPSGRWPDIGVHRVRLVTIRRSMIGPFSVWIGR